MVVGVFGQQTVGIARHGNNGDMVGEEVGHEAQQFVRLSTIANGEYHIIFSNDSQVTMKYIEGIHKKTGSSRRREGRCYLRTDVSTLSHSGNDEFSLAA